MDSLLFHPPPSAFAHTLPARSSPAQPAVRFKSAPLLTRLRAAGVFTKKTEKIEGFRTRWGCLHLVTVLCSSCNRPSSSSSTNRWDDHDEDYVEAHVLEAVSILPSRGHLFMGLPSGGEVEVDYINPSKGPLLFRSRNPTMFLKINDDSDLLLPIVVGEVAISMLMKALHGDEKIGRPNHYHLIRDVIAALNYEVRMIRVTERVVDTYHARIYLGRPDEEEMQSVDARPSDAINLAVRCKVPIFVNKAIVAADAMKPVCITDHSSAGNPLMKSKASFLDCPENGPDPVAEEITLMKNMLLAVVEERYADAAHWRDELSTFRTSKRRLRKRQAL